MPFGLRIPGGLPVGFPNYPGMAVIPLTAVHDEPCRNSDDGTHSAIGGALMELLERVENVIE